MRLFKGFRTYIFNVVAAIVPILSVLSPLLDKPELRAVVPPDWLPWYSLVVVVVNLWLRSVTTTPPGKKL